MLSLTNGCNACGCFGARLFGRWFQVLYSLRVQFWFSNATCRLFFESHRWYLYETEQVSCWRRKPSKI